MCLVDSQLSHLVGVMSTRVRKRFHLLTEITTNKTCFYDRKVAIDAYRFSKQDRLLDYQLPANWQRDDIQRAIRSVRSTRVRRNDEWDIQSTEVQMSQDQSSNLVAENLVFHDANVSETVDMGSMNSGNYYHDEDASADLGKFLSRPVRIGTYTWTQTPGFYQTFQPWNLFFSDAQIKRKLENFGKISCRLHLKFLVNGSPFHYGSLRACYFPLGGSRSVYQNGADLLPFSQTPGVYIEPQSMSSAEMVLPFLWPHTWLEVTKLSDFTSMGVVNLTEFWQLASANGATSPVTLLVYAWAEDVQLMGPTTIGALQSEEESSSGGSISGPARALAGAANALATTYPETSAFALPAAAALKMTADVAAAFGYSNAPVMEDVKAFQNKTFHAFANTEQSVPLDKLSIDPKNEVTISPGVAGVPEKDPLTFNEFLTKESLINFGPWSTVTAVDGLLFSALVGPHYAFLNSFRTVPPLTYASSNFRFWRGSLVYRFKFIKSKFHKGRVLISYDPNGDISANPDTETVTFSRVVDLESEDEVEFVVPYKATAPLAQVVPIETFPTTSSTAASPGYTYDSVYYNGSITMRVQTQLSAPITTSTIGILIYVKAGDDFVFAGPQQINHTLTTRDPLGVIQSSETTVVQMGQKTPQVDDKVALITTGEVLNSLRPLMHRTHYVISQFVGQSPPTAVGNVVATNSYFRVPPGLGRTIAGQAYNRANTAASYPYNFCPNNPIDWILECFVGYRGSMNLHANVVCQGSNVRNINSFSAQRWYYPVASGTTFNANGTTSVSAITGANTVAAVPRTRYRDFLTGGGVSLTNPQTQSALSVNLPQYWPLRFYQAFHNVREIDPRTGNPIYDNVMVRTGFSNSVSAATATDYPVLEIFQSAGVDFTPIFYLCTPRIWAVPSLPTASDA